jgi:hypothetical protein
LIFKKGETATKYSAIAAALAVGVLAIGAASTPAGAVPTCNQQTTLPRPIELGVSGGNINSFGGSGKHRFCFDGTLGSLVQDSSNNQYILSNNHVLADINKAKPGQLIVQPGLAENAIACQKMPGDAIATFTRTVKIKFSGKNTIDAAIAAVDPNDVSPDILNIGAIAETPATPTMGLAVEKMGRSTCFTTGTISSVSGNFKINYGGGKVAKFINQIVINSPAPPNNFGGSGDSGSLIVTQDTCPQPVALLFAGSADQTQTLANPITDVLDGLKITMVGSCTPAATASSTVQADVLAGSVGMSKDVVDSASAVRDRHEDELMKIPGAVGTAIGMSDQPGKPAIEVYVKKMTPQAQAAAPKEVEGVPVKLIENGGFVAY